MFLLIVLGTTEDFGELPNASVPRNLTIKFNFDFWKAFLNLRIWTSIVLSVTFTFVPQTSESLIKTFPLPLVKQNLLSSVDSARISHQKF